METNYGYVIWMFAIWICLQLGQCTQNQYNRDIIKELHEIKMEMKVK